MPVLTDLDPAAVTEADLPVLIKASAGGGGRGMRIVRSLADLPEALAAAASEAAAAFGDPAVFCEPYVQPGPAHRGAGARRPRRAPSGPRGARVLDPAPPSEDHRGGAVAAGASARRGCATELFEAARLAAAAIGYVSAGTVEFLADETGRFWFLEMNTRLQVEHPVTEATTGLDLVALQLAGR